MKDDRKKLRIIVSVLAAALLLAAAVVAVFFRFAVGLIGYEADEGELPTVDPSYAAGQGIYFPDLEPIRKAGVINVLFLGTDYRLTDGDRGRADSNMLCSLNTRTGEIRLVSFERGIGVPIPGRGSDLLTHAYRWGGPGLSQSILSQMFCLSIDGYVQVDFGSFADVIDAIGGVDVELTELEAKALNGEIPTVVWAWGEMHEGMNHLSGHDALQYCRLRSIDSDWNRQQRQRTVLEQVMKKCRGMSPAGLLKLANTVLPMIHTNLSKAEIASVLRTAPRLARGTVTQLQVPDPNGHEGTIRCVPEYEAKKIASFLYDTGYDIKSPY